MTERMIANLYLSSESFKHNGTDADNVVTEKLVDFHDLVDTLLNYRDDNKLYVFKDGFLNSPLFQDGTTVQDIFEDPSNSLTKYGKDAVTLFFSIFKHFHDEQSTIDDIKEYLEWEDENNCHGVLVFNSTSSLPRNHQVISNVAGWLSFRRHYLAKYPKSPEFFAKELCKYFPRIIFHSSLSQQISDVYTTHSFSIISCLSVLENNLVSDYANYGKDFIGFLNWFAGKYHLDGASFEGTKDKKFEFDFTDQTVVYCEPHLKMYRDDSGNTNQHCRIYFGKPKTSHDEHIYVGCICKHL